MALVALDWQDPVPDACRGGALSIGNFAADEGNGTELTIETPMAEPPPPPPQLSPRGPVKTKA